MITGTSYANRIWFYFFAQSTRNRCSERLQLPCEKQHSCNCRRLSEQKLRNQGKLFTCLSLILAIAHVHVGMLIAKCTDWRLQSLTQSCNHDRPCKQHLRVEGGEAPFNPHFYIPKYLSSDVLPTPEIFF